MLALAAPLQHQRRLPAGLVSLGILDACAAMPAQLRPEIAVVVKQKATCTLTQQFWDGAKICKRETMQQRGVGHMHNKILLHRDMALMPQGHMC